ncbi:hypothetical protein L2E82_17606 [Cichorium intybus]|uniref:Uncharacterized protein n=1 Tax=Cichorium intybus TaxID=13427 RepID=A0ACB9F995_CICIN|nr:hypothetical protein L2E82_17606 [Cichorium intybus]
MMMVKLLRSGRRQLHTIITRELIKPSSPTPPHLKTYNLSSVDQLFHQTYIPLILFYANNGDCSFSTKHIAQEMKKSLSHSLTRYYPFAGRLPTPTTPYVDCNDEGVIFVEAKNDSQLKTFQDITEQDRNMDHLFADGLVCENYPLSTNIAGVQLNHFACGGVGVAVSMSHIIGDGSTLGSFVNHWASVARYGSLDHQEVLALNPHFVQYPKTLHIQPKSPVNQAYANLVTKKFLFTNTKLSHLKNKVNQVAAAGSTPRINNPTRVEVLTSLLYKTAITAAMKKSGYFKPSYLLMPVDLRDKLVEKLPQTTVGNLLALMMVPTTHETEISLSAMTAEIKKAKSQLQGVQSVQHAAENLQSLMSKFVNEGFEDVAKRSYVCSSLCGFPFNKVDFGWGKPTSGILALKPADSNGFVLKDTPDGDGIEALVILEKEDMEIFQNDKELLSFGNISE